MGDAPKIKIFPFPDQDKTQSEIKETGHFHVAKNRTLLRGRE